jgi:hypothetical protein
MNEKELIQYVQKLNNEIEVKNKTRPPLEQEELYDINMVLKGFYQIQRKDEIKAFREIHECKFCLYFDKPRKCKAKDSCPLEKGVEIEKPIKAKKCIRDEAGNCPYGRAIEVCIGYCINDMVKEHRKKWSFRYEEAK